MGYVGSVPASKFRMSRAANASSSADHLPRRVLAAGAAGAGGASPQGGAASASDGARSRLRVAARRGASGAATSGLAVSVSRFSSSDSVSTGAMTGTALSTSIGDPVSSPSQVTLRCSVAGCSMGNAGRRSSPESRPQKASLHQSLSSSAGRIVLQCVPQIQRQTCGVAVGLNRWQLEGLPWGLQHQASRHWDSKPSRDRHGRPGWYLSPGGQARGGSLAFRGLASRPARTCRTQDGSGFPSGTGAGRCTS